MQQIFYASLILLPLGISLRISLRLLYGARGPQVGDPIYQIMHVLSWVLTLAPLLVLIVVGTNWLSWLLLMVTGTAGVEMILAHRAMQRQSAWALVTGKLDGGESLPAVLRRQEGRFTGMVGRAFRRLVAMLEQGTDLRTAISRNRDALPRWAQAYTAIGMSTVSEPRQPGTQPDLGTSALVWRQLCQRFSYVGMLLVIMSGIVAFLVFKIVPSYQDIFADFDLDLPVLTNSLIGFSAFLIESGLLVILLVGLAVVLPLGLLVVLLYLCDVPVLRLISDRLFFAQHRAFVLQLLASAAERGEPFTKTLQQLTAHERPHYPSRYVRRRLGVAARSLAAGQSWREALRRGSILKQADFPMLKTAEAVGNLPWVLRLLAGQKMRSMLFRWSAVEQVAFPCVIGLLGLLVMWVCVALFLPLVDLIQGLI